MCLGWLCICYARKLTDQIDLPRPFLLVHIKLSVPLAQGDGIGVILRIVSWRRQGDDKLWQRDRIGSTGGGFGMSITSSSTKQSAYRPLLLRDMQPRAASEQVWRAAQALGVSLAWPFDNSRLSLLVNCWRRGQCQKQPTGEVYEYRS
jgi:hypothetical protein